MSPRHLLRLASSTALGAALVAYLAFKLADPYDVFKDFWAVWAICGVLSSSTLWLLSFTADKE